MRKPVTDKVRYHVHCEQFFLFKVTETFQTDRIPTVVPAGSASGARSDDFAPFIFPEAEFFFPTPAPCLPLALLADSIRM
jgi:hypothetical protein